MQGKSTTDPSKPTACPYPGLRAFFTDETDWYFGRETHVHAALMRIEESRFLAIVGASGSGKSSLVFAGLIPALKAGELAGGLRDPASGTAAPWNIIHFRPGDRPIMALAEALRKDSHSADDPLLPGYIQSALRSGDMGLIEALESAGHLDSNREVLVYADQFEELFHYGLKDTLEAREDSQRFVRLLLTAATQRKVRVHIILSMRSDFIGDCDRFAGLPELISGSQFLTPRLSRKQMEQSFGIPAEVQQWRVEPEAINTLLNDCGDSPDQLPLAQHVMRCMWHRASQEGRRTLSIDDYNHVDGFKGSLSKHGAKILDGLQQTEGDDAEEIARKLFMALCDSSEDGALVRRLSNREELAAIAGISLERLELFLSAFGGDDPGFIREDESGELDVRHESILRQWHRIAEWRQHEASSENWLQQLSKASKDMESVGFHDSEMWRGNKLLRARQWQESSIPNNVWATRHGVKNWRQCEDFLSKSINLEVAENCKAKKQARRRTQSIIGAIATLLVFSASMTGMWHVAEKDKKRALNAEETAKLADEKTQRTNARLNVLIETLDSASKISIPALLNDAQTESILRDTHLIALEAALAREPVFPPDPGLSGLIDSAVAANVKSHQSTKVVEDFISFMDDATSGTDSTPIDLTAELKSLGELKREQVIKPVLFENLNS